jgi:hypothetical protein
MSASTADCRLSIRGSPVAAEAPVASPGVLRLDAFLAMVASVDKLPE